MEYWWRENDFNVCDGVGEQPISLFTREISYGSDALHSRPGWAGKAISFKTQFSPRSSFEITWSVQTNPTNHSTRWGLDYATKTVPLNVVMLRFMLQRLTQKKCQYVPGVRKAILNIYTFTYILFVFLSFLPFIIQNICISCQIKSDL